MSLLRSRRVFVLSACLGLAAVSATRLSAVDLSVQGTNSPYSFTGGTASYDNIYVGNTASGTLNQSGGTLTAATGQLFLGGNAGVTGTYNLSGGVLNTISTDVGDSGTGVFTLSGGAHNVTGTDATANGSLDVSFYQGSSGTYNLNGGTLTAGYVRGNQGTSTFNFNGGTLTAGASATDFLQNLTYAYVQAGGAILDTGSYNVTAAQSLVSGASSGSADGGLTKLGSGTLTLTGTNTYTGATTVSAGTLAVNGSMTGGNVNVGTGATLAISSTGSVQPGSGGQLTVDGTSTSAAAVTLDGAGKLSTGAAFVGNSGTGSFTQTGGTFTTNSGPFHLGYNSGSSGTYSLSGTGSLSTQTATVGYFGAGTFNQSGGSFSTNGNFLILGASNSSSGGTYNLSAGSLTTSTTQVGDGAATSTFTQTGGTHTTGTLRLTGINSNSVGIYSLRGGTLNVGAVTTGSGYYNNSQTGISTFNFGGGTLQASAGTASFFQNLTTANVQTGGARIDTNGFNVTIAQPLLHDTTTGAAALDGGLTKLGAGMLILTGANTYTGPTTVSAGTLGVGSDANLGAASSAVNLLNGAALVFANSTVTTGRTYNLGTSTLSPASGGTLTFAGAAVNGGTLGAGNQVLGSGTSLNGVRTTTGTILSQSSGSVAWNNVTLGGNSTFTQAAGATLSSAGEFITTPNSTMVISGTVNAAGSDVSGALTINNGGIINGTGGSAAPLYLDGSRGTTINTGGQLNAASGSTIELGGLLVNNGTQTGVLNVNLGGVARGTGTFGTVNVGNGGRFGVNTLATAGNGSATNGLATIRLTGTGGLARTAFVGPQLQVTPATVNVVSLALGSGSVFAFNVQDAQGAAGTGYDTAHVSGALALSAGTATGGQITISVASLNPSGTAGQANNFDPTQNYSFVLVSADGGVSGYNPAEFVVDTNNFQNNTNGGNFSVVQQGNNLDLVFTSAVPEPSTWALLVVGTVGLCLVARHRRHHAAGV